MTLTSAIANVRKQYIAASLEYPRSWSAEDQRLAALLPPEIRAILFKRERDRDNGLRIAQNKLADERKRLSRKIGVAAELEKYINQTKGTRT
jgi:hypothetical protein